MPPLAMRSLGDSRLAEAVRETFPRRLYYGLRSRAGSAPSGAAVGSDADCGWGWG